MKDYSFETSVKNCDQVQKKLLNEINQKDKESKLRLDIEGFVDHQNGIEQDQNNTIKTSLHNSFKEWMKENDQFIKNAI